MFIWLVAAVLSAGVVALFVAFYVLPAIRVYRDEMSSDDDENP
jgi:hypothetical protein